MSLLFSTLSRFVIVFLPGSMRLLISWLQSPSSGFRAQENKICHCFHFSSFIRHEMMGPAVMMLVFWMLSFKPALSLSSFTLIKRLILIFILIIQYPLLASQTNHSFLDLEFMTNIWVGCQSFIFQMRNSRLTEVTCLSTWQVILWPPDVKNWHIGKDPDAGKDWKREEKGVTEDQVVGWHHQLNGHEFEQAPGVGDGQESLACCSPWGRIESDTIEQLDWTDDRQMNYLILDLFAVGRGLREKRSLEWEWSSPAKWPGFESCWCYLPAMWPWVCHRPFQSVDPLVS